MTSFVSVSTSAARFQDISLNPQKLAGQCAKLKCCLNYEVDCYVEAQNACLPKKSNWKPKTAYSIFKADILSNQITHSTDKISPANLVTISGKTRLEIIGLNKGHQTGEPVGRDTSQPKKPVDLLEQESLTCFDRNRKTRTAETATMETVMEIMAATGIKKKKRLQ